MATFKTAILIGLLWAFFLPGGHAEATAPQARIVAPEPLPSECLPHYSAPTTLFGELNYNGSDSGISALRFLDLTVIGKPVGTLAGVDLSSETIDEVSTSVDMVRLKYCGASFVFLRLTGRSDYVTVPPHSTKKQPIWQMWNDALAAGLEVYPFHFLYPNATVLTGKIGGGFPYTNASKQVLFAEMTSEGHSQAAEFIKAYRDPHLNPQPTAKGRLPFYISLDIEVPLPDQFAKDKQHGKGNRFDYALGYARMACAWISDVQKKFQNAKIILYTNMRMDGEYQVMNANYTDNQCLAGYDVWMALPTAHGGHFADDESNPCTRTKARKFCFAGNPGHDRCTIHQFTQRGHIALTVKKGAPPDMDLDRFDTEDIPWDNVPEVSQQTLAKYNCTP